METEKDITAREAIERFMRTGKMPEKDGQIIANAAKLLPVVIQGRAMFPKRGRLYGPVRFPRNGPCPCGSGLKYKKCCLRKN